MQGSGADPAERQARALAIRRAARGVDERRRRGSRSRSLSEICDDDYRTFCLPCHALEEREEGGPGR